jgi:phosphoglycerate dehydrogenase-like enzyme
MRAPAVNAAGTSYGMGTAHPPVAGRRATSGRDHTKTLGLIGAGMIGGTVARLAVAAGLDVVLSNFRGPGGGNHPARRRDRHDELLPAN